MLDTEPTNTESSSAESGTSESTSARPAKRAARKAPSKATKKAAPTKAAPTKAARADRAPADPAAAARGDQAPADQPATAQAPAKAPRKARKAPAKKAAAAADQAQPAATPDQAQPAAAPSQPAVPDAVPAAADQAPAKKATRKRVAKKVAPTEQPAEDAGGTPTGLAPQPQATAAPADTASADQAPVGRAPRGQAAAGKVSGDEAPADKAPAKKATRKRAAKKATTAETDQPAEVADQPAEEQPAAAPALAAPAVLFQPPTEAPATRRRRSSRAKAEQTVEQGGPDQAAEAAEPTAEPGEPAAGPEAETTEGGRRRRRRGRRGRGKGAEAAEAGPDATEAAADAEEAAEDAAELDPEHADEVAEAALSASARRRRRRRRASGADGTEAADDDPPNTVVHIRDSRAKAGAADDDGVRGVKGSTRLEAKRQRRRDNRDSGRRRAPILTEAEFLARRESVERVMAVRQTGDRTQIAVLEDGILVEHYVTRASSASAVGNVYLGRVQNVLPSMEAAFVDIGRGRNGVLYAGEVNWDTAGLAGKARSIENALNPGDAVLVQVTKDPIGHKGARLTSQISLPGRFVVYVPGGGMTGISRKLPDTERSRLKSILKKVVPDEAGVIVRTAAEGASEQDLISDVERLKAEWESISAKAARTSDAPMLVHGEPDLAIRVVRDIFNDDFAKLVVAGTDIHRTLSDYVGSIAPDLAGRISLHTAETDLFRDLRVDEQLAKALDRKVWLPSGGSLVIDRTEAMTVIDVNTGKYTGSGGNLEQTVTRNNLEAAEEIVRQLRLRDLGGIVVIDFIDMVLESNRELVLRRLTECLGRDRTKHQVAEVTSLGLVQMTRKRVGEGLLEAFSEPCEHCHGRGVLVHLEPVDRKSGNGSQPSGAEEERPARSRRSRSTKSTAKAAAAKPDPAEVAAESEKRRAAASAIAAIAAATSKPDNGEPENGEPGSSNAGAPVEAAGQSEQAEGQPEQAEGQPAGVAGQSEQAEAPVIEKQPARPRRRRAASRPAGPPVATTGTDG